MPVLLFLIGFVPLSIALAGCLAEPADRGILIRRTLLAWIVLVPLTAFMNEWMPFAGGGDDEYYLIYANPPPSNLDEALDLNRFQELLSQPGYAWILSLLNAVIGHELLAYKLLNLFFLIALSLVWYRIGLILEGRRFARQVALAVLLLTPLWYHVSFLLKDMTITLLQSLALLGTVQVWTRARPVSVVLLGGSSLFLLLLRTPLLLQNAGVLAGSVLLKGVARGTRHRGIAIALLLGLSISAALLVALSNPEFVAALGVQDPRRTFSDSMLDDALMRRDSVSMSPIAFPAIYLLSETAGLNPRAWESFDGSWLRGVLALPWIFLVVPCSALGICWLTGTHVPCTRQRNPVIGWIARLRSSDALATPWTAVLLFIASSFAISWVVGDTTRLRIPDMPMFASVALLGWTRSAPALRTTVLLWWTVGLGSLYGVLQLARAM